jgi:hypothetical protein
MQLDCSINQLGAQLGDIRLKATSGEVAVEDLQVDAAHNIWRRHLDRKGGKVALHAGRDVEAACCGVYAGHVLAGLDLLEQNLDLVIPAANDTPRGGLLEKKAQ